MELEPTAGFDHGHPPEVERFTGTQFLGVTAATPDPDPTQEAVYESAELPRPVERVVADVAPDAGERPEDVIWGGAGRHVLDVDPGGATGPIRV